MTALHPGVTVYVPERSSPGDRQIGEVVAHEGSSTIVRWPDGSVAAVSSELLVIVPRRYRVRFGTIETDHERYCWTWGGPAKAVYLATQVAPALPYRAWWVEVEVDTSGERRDDDIRPWDEVS